MHILSLIEQSTATALDKGFNVTQHETQLLMMATEIAEALEHVTPGSDQEMMSIRVSFERSMERLEKYRKSAKDYTDTSALLDPENRSKFVEELADNIIRTCSYAGGNGLALELAVALESKTVKNRVRPYLHDKRF